MEQPTAENWTLDPAIYDYTNGYTPPDYCTGFLATSWEFTDPLTYVLHIRQDVHYQNIAPANGRLLTAADIVYHYDRITGLGDGFTKMDPWYVSVGQFATLVSVTNPDNWTVVFKWSAPNVIGITGLLQSSSIQNSIECPEAVKQWGDLNDWHHAIGTGAFIVKDFVDSSALTVVKNPTYWGYDERYPQNRLPYIDTVKILVMPDQNTCLAAMRTGKIDYLDSVSVTDSTNMKKTNPEILQIGYPLGTILTLDPRNDVAPFSDIRVREALQMAIDIPTIASTYYQGDASPLPGTLTTYSMGDWGYPYSDWPQSLKDTYTYNPTAAKKLLADAGFPNGFTTDAVISSDSDMSLYQIVQSYFAAIGVKMSIQSMDPTCWLSYVLTNHKHDALAARNQGMIGLNYEPDIQINRFKTNYRVNYTMVSDPNYDALVTQALSASTTDAYKAIMQKVNQLVAQQHYVISVCQPELFTCYQPWVGGFTNQNESLSATGANSALWFFQFGARFWINSNLKTSLGH
jgi:peptide/nickel transport system substrate-binding protein